MTFNLPNKITLARIILIPIFMAFLLVDFGLGYEEYIALAIFIIAAATDGLDGYIARKRGLVTNFGKFVDPLADKLLISAALISFVDLDVISAWPVMIIIAREFAVTGLRVLAASEGIVIAASNLGKYKTNAQIFAIIALVLNLSFDLILLWIAVLLTIVSGADYLINSKEVIKGDNNE
ncbi:CDP-diacylglycerol--glycerol-3-phosphate 3-phosphatidyltransferase [Halobacteroides halobius DSM 5150]|uniref:CDP-diacylglycerol--glycerol-3-phosphate 3-phosphatidyltransferase n=1 Tax=Halobacteroides halobius (strain ATCC 35273 / DSM 5150 / MD-1) TaxID=748449 RepID=L0KAI1_HALHC|nr:CDP-diacylglycerol--glycerol-3-phosphate 3-phosphatidyltransferase [Halobacteroides halobius]AGB41555.1 CDP-diacylglycerol--glycerol-3-phosphate 3-phosphatidyltransferase [Halobacteroides halobius DSM 5150]